MRSRLLSFAVVASLVAASIAAGCSGGGDTSTGGGASSGGHDDAGTDAPASITLRIEPESVTTTVTLGAATPTTIAYRAFAKSAGEDEHEVTTQVEWSVGPKVATMGGATATLKGVGGKTTVSATLGGVETSSPLTVKLVGDVFLGGADPSTKQAFDGATTDPDPAAAPALEYPEDGVVLPGNLPPIEAQWTQAGDSTSYRVRLVSEGVLDLAFFTTSRELLFPADAWAAVAQSTPDLATTVAVDGLGAMLHAGAPRSLTIASDAIDDSAIYVWQSSTGSFRVLDIVKGTDVPLPNDSPALGAGQPCSGCHRISRDGKRFAYTYNGGNFEFGSLVYDEVKGLYTSKIVPTPGVRGTYATFNPLESTTVAAMLLTVPDTVPQNTPGTVRLQLVDPDTNAPVPSNIAATIGMIDPAVGHATMMPDWSPDGSFVVFAAYNSDANYVRLLGDDIVLASIVEAPVSYSANTGFTFGAPKVLVTAPAGANPDTGQNNLLPTISPDGTAVAFTRAAGWWSIKTQQSLINLSGQIAVVRRSDGQVLELVKGSNGAGTTHSSTWPQWAPSPGKRWAWLAYASERPYGHRLTAGGAELGQCGPVQGQKQCKHLWVTAIDRQKLAAGIDDPSSAAFFIPGQTLAAQYVSPQWTQAVLKPPQ